MIQVIISAVLVWGIISFLERGKDRGLEGFVVGGFVIAPAIIVFLLSLAIYALELPAALGYVLYIVYFAMPAAMLRFQFDFPVATSCLYGLIVLLAVVATQVVVALLLGWISA